MKPIFAWLKHAFAVEPPGPAQPSEAQRALLDRLCREVVQRRLTGPALIVLESSRPLTFAGGQLMHFFAPFLSVFAEQSAIDELARFLERRGAVDYLCQRLEELNAAQARERPADA